MKLRNKKTGEIIEFDAILPVKDVSGDSVAHLEYGSLAELNEEWEDAPEEAIQVYIEGIQEVHSGGGRVFIDYATAKEAELAVRKLKAWKRLKDNGFRFTGVEDVERTIRFEIPFRAGYDSCEAEADLDLLFGGEE